MRENEYETMFSLEQEHWWYQGLREVIAIHWDRHVKTPRPRLLDCGCGTGANLAALQPRCGLVAGFDFSPLAVGFSRRRGLHNIVVGNAMAPPYGDAQFDVAISCDVLYHEGVHDPDAALRAFRDMLRPGGLLMLNLPAYAWLRSSHDEHVAGARRFTRGQVRRMVKDAGMELVADTYWNSVLFPALAALRIAKRFTGSDESDVASSSEGATAVVARAALGLEQRLLPFMSLPFGLSVFTVARRIH